MILNYPPFYKQASILKKKYTYIRIKFNMFCVCSKHEKIITICQKVSFLLNVLSIENEEYKKIHLINFEKFNSKPTYRRIYLFLNKQFLKSVRRSIYNFSLVLFRASISFIDKIKRCCRNVYSGHG